MDSKGTLGPNPTANPVSERELEHCSSGPPWLGMNWTKVSMFCEQFLIVALAAAGARWGVVSVCNGARSVNRERP
jgi:hypothetical protein